jgi:hypothetical protein
MRPETEDPSPKPEERVTDPDTGRFTTELWLVAGGLVVMLVLVVLIFGTDVLGGSRRVVIPFPDAR